jgi:hypothetical protein
MMKRLALCLMAVCLAVHAQTHIGGGGTPYLPQGSSIASATTIAPPAGGMVFHVTGTTPIQTITRPAGCGSSTAPVTVCQAVFIFDGVAPIVTGGNIQNPFIPTAGAQITALYDVALAKWYFGACANYPCVVYVNTLTNQSAAFNGVALFAPLAGTYRFSCSEYVTTAGTAGTMQCGFNWKSNNASQSSLASPTTPMTTAGSATQFTCVAHTDGINTMSVFTNYTGTTGTPIYGLDIVLERMN